MEEMGIIVGLGDLFYVKHSPVGVVRIPAPLKSPLARLAHPRGGDVHVSGGQGNSRRSCAARSRALPALRARIQQRLARLHDREPDRLVPDLKPALALTSNGETRGGEIALFGKVLAVVRPPAVLALQGSARDHAADLDQRAQIEPV